LRLCMLSCFSFQWQLPFHFSERHHMSPDSLYFIVSGVFVVVIGYDIINWLKDQKMIAPEIRLARFQSKVNATAFILGITMVIASFLFHINFFRYSGPVPFSEIDKITLKDFKGFRRPYQTLDGGNEFAFIVTSLAYEKNGNQLKVEALFHPSRSYTFNDNLADKSLLQHELYHFRITEIFARKCRQELSELKQVPSNQMLDDIIDSQKTLEREMQYRYDDESYHSYIMKEQKRWEKKIDSLLTLSEKYKNPVISYE
jgi:hypothetical protein